MAKVNSRVRASRDGLAVRLFSANGGYSGGAVVYEAIASAIVEQRLPPETKLGEDALGRIFGVSRTGIRGVLARLAHEKMVVLRPNRGAFVSSPSVDEAGDVFSARAVIEAATTAEAVRRMTRSALVALGHHVAAERRALKLDDRRAAIRLSGEFHLRLAEHGANAVLLDVLRELVSRTSLIIAVYGGPASVTCAPVEHSDLLRAVATRQPQRAVGAMRRHLERVRAGLNWAVAQRRVDLREALVGRERSRS